MVADLPGLIVDTDVHNALTDVTDYLPASWRARWREAGYGVGGLYHNPRGVPRRDATPPDGGPPGSDPQFLIDDHLDRFGIDYAILTGPGTLPLGSDPDYADAIASAYNDCTIERWLPVTDRFRGSVLVYSDDPPAAAAEIRRVGSHPHMVQVMMASTSRAPYGQRQYHPIYEAAVEMGLPVAIHPGTEGAGSAWPPTPAGYPSRYLEWHNILPVNYMSQINSLVCEGVFEKFPTLRFVAIEGGLAWLPHLMWRMDKNYKALRDTVPWLRRLPSEYILDHVRLTTQPIEEPADPRQLLQILAMMSAERTVMFSSDYPHWDNDNPSMLLTQADPALRQRIFAGTACELYGIDGPPNRDVRIEPRQPAVAGTTAGAGPAGATQQLGQVE